VSSGAAPAQPLHAGAAWSFAVPTPSHPPAGLLPAGTRRMRARHVRVRYAWGQPGWRRPGGPVLKCMLPLNGMRMLHRQAQQCTGKLGSAQGKAWQRTGASSAAHRHKRGNPPVEAHKQARGGCKRWPGRMRPRAQTAPGPNGAHRRLHATWELSWNGSSIEASPSSPLAAAVRMSSANAGSPATSRSAAASDSACRMGGGACLIGLSCCPSCSPSSGPCGWARIWGKGRCTPWLRGCCGRRLRPGVGCTDGCGAVE